MSGEKNHCSAKESAEQLCGLSGVLSKFTTGHPGTGVEEGDCS